MRGVGVRGGVGVQGGVGVRGGVVGVEQHVHVHLKIMHTSYMYLHICMYT